MRGPQTFFKVLSVYKRVGKTTRAWFCVNFQSYVFPYQARPSGPGIMDGAVQVYISFGKAFVVRKQKRELGPLGFPTKARRQEVPYYAKLDVERWIVSVCPCHCLGQRWYIGGQSLFSMAQDP